MRQLRSNVALGADICAACHSRRKVIAKHPVPGEPYLDAYLHALLEHALCHADGQIDGEVYEYGSFLQSRMYHAGVTCSDCHYPHSAKLRTDGNALCGQCHAPAKFDVAEHYHHHPGTAGAQCVNCHMPTKSYMVIDVRRDHSIRVPRPDLSVSLDTPNACTQCHADRPAEWAMQTVAGWFPGGRQTTPQYGSPACRSCWSCRCGTAARPADPRSESTGGRQGERPAIAGALCDIRLGARDQGGGQVGRSAGAAGCSAPIPYSSDRAVAERPASRCPHRGGAGARRNRSVGAEPQQTAFVRATAELIAAEKVDADRPEAHLNLGLFEMRRGEPSKADTNIARLCVSTRRLCPP
jgi:predicted CXXCH cytochrome family protein